MRLLASAAMRLRLLIAGLGVVALAPGTALGGWLAPVRITPPGPAAHASPDVAVAGGRALATWLRTAAPAAATGQVVAAVRARPAGPWTRRALSGATARAPKAALNHRGDAVVAWISGRSVVAGVRRGSGGPWAVARVADAAGAVQDLTVAMSRSGRPTVMWSERRDDDFSVHLSVRPSATAGWSLRPARLAMPGPTPPALALSPGRGALVAWTEDGHTLSARTVGGVFERAGEISGEDSASPGAGLSTGGAGLVAWGTGLPGGTSVVLGAERVSSGTAWAAPEDLGIGRAPQVALNDRGDAVVAWSLDGLGEPQGIEAATRRRGGVWHATTVVPRRTCRCALSVRRAAVDATGAVLVSWSRDDAEGAGGGGAAAGRAGGSAWTRPAFEPARVREAPAVAAGDAGGGIAVWTEDGPSGGVRAATLTG